MTDPNGRHALSAAPSDASLGELFARMSEQTSTLIRAEMRLAQAELTAKGKRAGVGAGLFGGAGLFAVYGLGCLVAAAVLALAGPLTGWLAAIIVGAVLLLVAGVSALMGRKQITQAVPPVPQEAVDGLKRDVHTLISGSSS